MYHNATLTHLSIMDSGHALILLNNNPLVGNCHHKQFKFEAKWLIHDDFFQYSEWCLGYIYLGFTCLLIKSWNLSTPIDCKYWSQEKSNNNDINLSLYRKNWNLSKLNYYLAHLILFYGSKNRIYRIKLIYVRLYKSCTGHKDAKESGLPCEIKIVDSSR